MRRFRTFTAIVMWPDVSPSVVEEVDVLTTDLEAAKLEVRQILDREYRPGWKIVEVKERT